MQEPTNEFLIVIWWKVMAKRGGKKGPSLVYWFQQSMGSGDSSDKEAPPSNPNRKELMRKEQLAVVSMLVAMKTDNSLRRGAIMFITKKFGMAHFTVYHLWERAKRAHELGIINSPEFILHKKTLEEVTEFQQKRALSNSNPNG